MDIFSPIDGSLITRLRDTPPSEVANAITEAATAFKLWSSRDAMSRSVMLRRVGHLMLERENELANIETRNVGSPYEASLEMVRRAAGSFIYFSELADKVTGDVIPVEGEYFTYSVREAHGVVAAIVPWNAPIIFAAKKLAPALAFGNACLLKPSPETPLSALLLEELMSDAGLPEGLARVLPGGRDTGQALVSDPRISLIVFTGHDSTGKAIARSAATNLVPVGLELGGKSAQLVFADSPQNRVVEGLVSGVFGNTGQACMAGSRILIEASIQNQVLQALAERTRAIRTGDPRDTSTELGPQTTQEQAAKTNRMVQTAVKDGARVIAAGELPEHPSLSGGYYVRPTLLTDVTPDMEIAREEVFGPVAVVTTFNQESEAVALANDTPYGLAAGIWSNNAARVHRVARQLRAGSVWVNTYGVISDRVPFGGIGRSGYGREGGQGAIELYTRQKAVWTSLHEDEPTPDVLLP